MARKKYNDGINVLDNSNGQLIEQTDPADANGVRRKTFITYQAPNGR